jgi:peptidoglycan hydrolase-like protein with peptidoglycan-binding domain
LAKSRKTQPVELAETDAGVRALPVVMWLSTAALAAMIAYNAMFLQPQPNKQGANALREDTIVDPRRVTITLKHDRDVEALQRELLSAGLYQGLVDGIMGEKTKSSIEAYQKANGLPVDGKVSTTLIEHVRYTRKLADAAGFTGSADTAQSSSSPRPVTESSSKEEQKILMVQYALADLGYDPGEANGQMSETTRAAVRKFESDRGIPATGEISRAVLKEMSKTTGYENIFSEFLAQ